MLYLVLLLRYGVSYIGKFKSLHNKLIVYGYKKSTGAYFFWEVKNGMLKLLNIESSKLQAEFVYKTLLKGYK